MITSLEELMLDRANATLAKLGLPAIAKSDDVRRKRLMRAIARAAGGPADVLVNALLEGDNAGTRETLVQGRVTREAKTRDDHMTGKALRAALRTKAEGEAHDIAQAMARIKSAIEDHDNGGFFYLDIDGRRLPVTNVTRRAVGLEPSSKAAHAYVGRYDRTEIVLTGERTRSGKQKALLAPVRKADLSIYAPDVEGDDIVPRRPAVEAFVEEQRRRKAVAEAERQAWARTQAMARLRARAAAERAAADPNDVARIDPRTMQLIASPSEAKAQAEADAVRRERQADADAERQRQADTLKAIADARHAEAVRQHEERRRRGLPS